jgi:uncharacterized protein YcnI
VNGSSVQSASELAATHEATGSSVSSGCENVSASGSQSGSDVPDLSVVVPTIVSDRPHTRLQSGVSKPKKFTDGTVQYAYFCSTGEPSTTAEAFADSRWKAAMDEEYDVLLKNNTWHLVPSTHGQHVIDCK